LNQLWGKAVGIVNRHHGVVNKFLGDGFMAVFGGRSLWGTIARMPLTPRENW